MKAERFDTVLLGGDIATPEGVSRADLGILDGRIVAIGHLSGADANEVISTVGLTIMPGVIDSQVHFREPGMEHKEDLESGTRAAIAGGVTTIFEMPNTQPPTTSAPALADKVARATGRAWCDFAFFIGGTRENAEQLPELEQLPGCCGVKIFVGSSTGSLLVEDDPTILKVLQNGRRIVSVHSEDEPMLRAQAAAFGDQVRVQDHPKIRSAEAAFRSTTRLINLAEATGRRVHILHISTKQELPLLQNARDAGLPVTCEVTPQHLTLDSSAYDSLGTKAQMNPPLRDPEHREALWDAVRNGLFSVMGSDHAPHTLDEKAKPYPKSPSGMPGVQTLLPLMLDHVAAGHLPIELLVQLTSAGPAELFSIRGKGRIAVGMDADLAIVDLKGMTEVTPDWLQSKCGWSPFEGATLRGEVIYTLLRGQCILREGALEGPPSGRPVAFTDVNQS